MNLNQLRYFISAGELRSFTQAAARYDLSQTAITQQVRALEESLGIRLVDRQKRPIELTPAGKVFLQEARAVLARMEEAVERTRRASDGVEGLVRIGYEKGYERSGLPEQLRSFRQAYPNILFTCVREDAGWLASRLLAGELDVIIGEDSGNLRQNEAMESVLREVSPLVVALWNGHPLAGKKSLRREDLGHDIILYGSSSGNSSDSSFGSPSGGGDVPCDMESIRIMVAAGEGIAIVPAYHGTGTAGAGEENLTFVPLEGEEEKKEIFMIWKKNQEDRALSCLLDHLMGEKGDKRNENGTGQ